MTSQRTSDEPSNTPDEVLAKTAQLASQQARTLALHIQQHDDIEAQAEEKARAITERLIADLESALQTAVDRATGQIEERQEQRFQSEVTRVLDDFNKRLTEIIDAHKKQLRSGLLAIEKAREENREDHIQKIQEIGTAMERAKDEADKRRGELEESNQAKLADATETMRREREEQLAAYERLRSKTTSNIQEMTANALDENIKSVDAKLQEQANATEATFRDSDNAMEEQKVENRAALARSEANWRRVAIITAAASATAGAIAVAALVTALL